MLGNGHNVSSAGGPSGNRRHELERLIAAKFPPEGKEQRVAAALRVLNEFLWDLRLIPEEVRWIAEDVDIEDL